MSGLYLILMLGTLACPLFLSFDRNVNYYKSWKNALIAAVIIAIPFIIWDSVFTSCEFWGFNEQYLIGIHLFNLPIEEIAFFIVVPFACTFIYEVIRFFFKNYKLVWFNRFFSIAIVLYAIFILFAESIGYYTVLVEISTLLTLAWALYKYEFRHVFLAFLFSLVPFFIVNGILTGTGLGSPIVWYSEHQINGLRLFTIPAEDILYSFSLLVPNILLFELLQRRSLS